MKLHPLTSEKTFVEFLGSLSCNGCKYFANEKCSHEKAEENEKDKPFLIDYHNKIGKPFNIEWAKNINNHFVCDNYENRSAKT